MTPAIRRWAGVAVLLAACSPEARRTRDGGAGADPGNKQLVQYDRPDPQAADSTLWPGRAPAPVDVMARGIFAPPSYPPHETARPPASQQHTFDRPTGDPDVGAREPTQ